MKKISFDFLDSMPLKEIDKSPVSVVGGKLPAAGADFRLFADGSIYPSQDLIQKDQLEFQAKESGIPEYGYDVFLSTDWSQYPGTVKFPCIAKVSKHEPRVDLFGQLKYNKDSTPKSSVMTMRSTQAEDLIRYLEESYCDAGETLFAHRTYVDLKINTARPMKTANQIYNLPKVVAKGKNAGQKSYTRRENIVVYPLEIIVESSSTVSTTPQSTAAPVSVPAGPGSVPEDIAKKVFG